MEKITAKQARTEIRKIYREAMEKAGHRVLKEAPAEAVAKMLFQIQTYGTNMPEDFAEKLHRIFSRLKSGVSEQQAFAEAFRDELKDPGVSAVFTKLAGTKKKTSSANDKNPGFDPDQAEDIREKYNQPETLLLFEGQGFFFATDKDLDRFRDLCNMENDAFCVNNGVTFDSVSRGKSEIEVVSFPKDRLDNILAKIVKRSWKVSVVKVKAGTTNTATVTEYSEPPEKKPEDKKKSAATSDKKSDKATASAKSGKSKPKDKGSGNGEKKEQTDKPEAVLKAEKAICSCPDEVELKKVVKDLSGHNLVFTHKRTGMKGTITGTGTNTNKDRPFLIITLGNGKKSRPFSDIFDRYYDISLNS